MSQAADVMFGRIMERWELACANRDGEYRGDEQEINVISGFLLEKFYTIIIFCLFLRQILSFFVWCFSPTVLTFSVPSLALTTPPELVQGIFRA